MLVCICFSCLQSLRRRRRRRGPAEFVRSCLCGRWPHLSPPKTALRSYVLSNMPSSGVSVPPCPTKSKMHLQDKQQSSNTLYKHTNSMADEMVIWLFIHNSNHSYIYLFLEPWCWLTHVGFFDDWTVNILATLFSPFLYIWSLESLFIYSHDILLKAQRRLEMDYYDTVEYGCLAAVLGLFKG